MNKLLKTLSMALLCIALSLCASCKKDNNSGTGGGTGGGTTQTTATITTNDVTEITYCSALCGGEVTSENGWAVTQRGVCWGTNPNPTLSDSHTIDGDGIGKFTSALTGLLSNTKYYVRAYAKNAAGTSFGQEKSFTTLSFEGLSFAVNGVSFNMIYVEGGTFYMGAQCTDPSGQNYDWEAYYWESPVHQVTLSDFYMGETEVTQALWQAVMGSNPSYSTGNDQRPVEQVSWNDCQTFINKLNSLLSSQLNGKQFRLPTEAEWEYAARGGNQSQGYKYSGSNNMDIVAWYINNSSSTTHPVAQNQANELGIYDMSGNVWEWCQDWYGDYSSEAQTDPTGPSSGSYRVYRGGCWINNARFCRVSYRISDYPGGTSSDLGLRLSLR